MLGRVISFQAMTKNKFLALVVLILSMLILISCDSSGGGNGQNESSDQTVAPDPTTPTPDPTPTPGPGPTTPVSQSNPIVFVANIPVISLHSSLSAFSNHGTTILDSIPGGDLFIRYPNGHLKNLTAAAGFGVPSGEIQESSGIAVRQPTVHWSGTKIIFSMLIGGPKERYDRAEYRRWQLYEVTGLEENDDVVITKVPNQPTTYNNISPIYGSKDDIFFISDAPLFGMKHTYPQLDEYETDPSNTGIWKIDRLNGKVSMIQHAPSGVFDLTMDSYGRILFTKWDHLIRDQQADIDRLNNGQYKSHDFPDESSSALKTIFPAFDEFGKLLADSRGVLYDQFPGAQRGDDPSRIPNEAPSAINQFFPWQIYEDGSEELTINHIGRHELGGSYMPAGFTDDPKLTDVLPKIANSSMRDTLLGSGGFFQFKEDPNNPGTYLGTIAPEFGTETSGRIVEFSLPPGKNPDEVVMKDYTNKSINYYPVRTSTRLSTMTGHYRNPLRLTDKSILVSHINEYRTNLDESTNANTTKPRYIFQIKKMIPNPSGTDMIAGPALTGGIKKHVRWWTDASTPKEYNGLLSETDAVEVRSRPRPPTKTMATDPIEKSVIAEEGVSEAELKTWLKANNLALIVSRNVTLRDKADKSQPYNLRIPNGVENIPTTGKIYDITKLQIFQGELTRGYGSRKGRRVHSRPIRNTLNNPNVEKYNNSQGSVNIGSDGSMAAFVPAGRALSWQLLDPTDKPVVRERVWVSFAPGEIRTCVSCHGINSSTHNNLPIPKNKPEALRNLIRSWKSSR